MTGGSLSLALPPVIGHRGAAAAAPENTLAGFRAAGGLGVAWVEFDVRLAADGTCILLHDDRVDRTTDGTGEAAQLTFAALRRLDAGAWFGAAFAGERIPSLSEAIALLAMLGLGANIEIKPAPGAAAATARAAVEVVRREWPARLPPPLLSSFEREALAAARAAAPDLPRGLLVGDLPADWQAQAESIGAATVNCDQRRLDHARARRVIDAGYPLLAYTVNQPERARELLAWGVSGVFTDRPDAILQGLADGGSRQTADATTDNIG
ncbi:MAG: glycerophosphodiester phosphodiesterase [Rhodospirillales bacterium]|nr:glycerophosphodiester phosphodiesterase [Rhodospirillales bacterium]